MGQIKANYFKCKTDEYSSFTKGKIYARESMIEYLVLHPNDWSPVLDYPTTNEILECIESGIKKTRIIKALKQWKKQK